ATGLTLPLLVPRVGGTDYVNAAFAPHHLAVLTNSLDACPHFHEIITLSPRRARGRSAPTRRTRSLWLDRSAPASGPPGLRERRRPIATRPGRRKQGFVVSRAEERHKADTGSASAARSGDEAGRLYSNPNSGDKRTDRGNLPPISGNSWGFQAADGLVQVVCTPRRDRKGMADDYHALPGRTTQPTSGSALVVQHAPKDREASGAVKTSTPSAVRAIVCSKWTLGRWSRVLT